VAVIGISTKDETDIDQLPKFLSGPPTRCIAREWEQKEQGEREGDETGTGCGPTTRRMNATAQK